MQPVSSVAAFVARYMARPADDPVAAAIVETLDREARLAVEAQALPAPQRRTWLRQRSGRDWSPTWLAHVEARAFVQLRRELQRQGLWRG